MSLRRHHHHHHCRRPPSRDAREVWFINGSDVTECAQPALHLDTGASSSVAKRHGPVIDCVNPYFPYCPRALNRR